MLASPSAELPGFGTATAHWFAGAFSEPTEVQHRGWASIRRGSNALLIAPTGSGKTLAAFLWCIDRLISTPPKAPGVRVLYISPLKALVYDVERNLGVPLRGIAESAESLGISVRLPQVGIRTGDTSPSERNRLGRSAPEILVTTPESLYLMLGSRVRETLLTVDTIIIDEVHALAPTKRGAHLALSIERLCAQRMNQPPPQRLGLSATAKPLEAVAGFLGGDHPVDIVDASARPQIDLKVMVPVDDMSRPPPPVPTPGEALSDEKGLWPWIRPELLKAIRAHRSTIIFVNSRGLAESLTRRLNEMAGEPLCRSHHGSLAHSERRVIEQALKDGALPCIVATSSLELGIDMGAVDLVLLVESPRSVARGLQRAGRAGHGVGERSVARIFPKHRGDLLETAVITERMLSGTLEPLTVPENPLDVLAQQVVAVVATQEQTVSGLLALVRRAANFRTLPESAYRSVLDMLSGLYPSHDFAELSPRIVWNRETDVLTARRGSKMLSLVSGGTIPDRGLYGVFLEDGGTRVGELDEEMVHETVAGEVITLGASSWRVERITRDQVLVRPAPGEVGKLPFWHGDGPGRAVALGRAQGAFLREISSMPEPQALERLGRRHCLDDHAARNLLAYIRDQREQTGTLPTDRDITVERFRDEVGDWRVCILTPFGSRVHAPWAIAIEEALSRTVRFRVESMWNDDGIALRMLGSSTAPDQSVMLPEPDAVEPLLMSRLGGSSLFAARFRENAARSLLMPRKRPGQRTPLWLQRLKSQQLLGVARAYNAFPVVMETYRTCLQDVFDLPALIDVLTQIQSGRIKVRAVETAHPSPFARSLAFAYVANYLYQADAPPGERRVQALNLDREMLAEILGQDGLRTLLDVAVLEQVETQLQALVEEHQPRNEDALASLIRRLGDLSDVELSVRAPQAAAEGLASLASAHRVVELSICGQRRFVAAENVGLYRDALGVSVPPTVPDAYLGQVTDALSRLLIRYAQMHGPFVAAGPAERYGLPPQLVEAQLEGLVAEGALLSGAFRPDGSGREWCDAEVLRRVKRGTIAKLRTEVSAVGPDALGRFLPEWHQIGVRPPDEPPDLESLQETIVQLEGLPLPVEDLESAILPARLPGYRPGMLDELGATGWVCWIGHGKVGTTSGKIALYRREYVGHLFEPPSAGDLSDLARDILTVLRTRGAEFFPGLCAALGDVLSTEIYSALRELMWRGLVTNDTFQPLRGGPMAAGRRSLGVSSRQMTQAAGGRWSPTEALVTARVSDTEKAHARCNTILRRHGVVCAAANLLEPGAGGFSALYAVLSEMESVGQCRRGYFVEGVGGAQFALPGATDLLRLCRDESDRETVLLAAVDPANPYGWILPWPELSEEAPKPRRVKGARVVLYDGALALYLAPDHRNLATFSSSSAVLEASLRALKNVAAQERRGFLEIRKIDGLSCLEHPLRGVMKASGFHRTPAGLELYGDDYR